MLLIDSGNVLNTKKTSPDQLLLNFTELEANTLSIAFCHSSYTVWQANTSKASSIFPLKFN
jgi:hypothetical protein